MDPDIALKALWHALRQEDYADAGDIAQNILDWLGKGGYPPRFFSSHLEAGLTLLNLRDNAQAHRKEGGTEWHSPSNN